MNVEYDKEAPYRFALDRDTPIKPTQHCQTNGSPYCLVTHRNEFRNGWIKYRCYLYHDTANLPIVVIFLTFLILIFFSISTIFIVYSSFIGFSSWQRGPRVAIWVGTCIGNQAKVKSVKGVGVWGSGCGARGVGVGGQRIGSANVWVLVILFILLVTVLHWDALHAPFPHWSSGLL